MEWFLLAKEQKQEIGCLKCKSLNIYLFIELLYKINNHICNHADYEEKNVTLRVILIIWNYINIGYTFSAPHILNYVIILIIDWIVQWKKALVLALV